MKYKKHNRSNVLKNTTQDFSKKKKSDVKAKKHLGQHFLTDLTIAQNIVHGLSLVDGYKQVLEIGPGMGVLTQFLVQNKNYQTSLIDIDSESIAYLHKHFPELGDHIIEGDFLNMDLTEIANNEPFAIIGNFPYNISTQILFKVLDYKDQIPEVVGMFQKEVAERIAAGPGSKTYGIEPTDAAKEAIKKKHKVFNNYFDIKIAKKLTKKSEYFDTIVKTAFNQRRKTFSNSLKPFLNNDLKESPVFRLRPEQLSVEQFVDLTNLLEKAKNS